MATYKIYQDKTLINRIEADQNFVVRYCEGMGYEYELEETSAEPEPEAPPTNEELAEQLVNAEQEITDLDLSVIEAQQTITDLELMILEGQSNE